MNITDLLKIDTIIIDIEANTKQDVMKELATKLGEANRIDDVNELMNILWKREHQVTTGIGNGIAIPHAKSKVVKEPSICFARSKQGVDFDSLDGKPTHLFFMIAVRDESDSDYLDTLSKLTNILLDEEFRDNLLMAETAEEIIQLFQKKEQEQREAAYVTKKILAVTACPTGIAHTYMAANALRMKAKELGIDLKVETNGSIGVRNILSVKDIEEADTIIVAADKHIDMARFRGKRLIVVPVSEGFRNAEQLLKRAINEEAPIYQGEEDFTFIKKNSWSIYKHLMNGVSNMLPFVVGGGVLIALAYMLNQINPSFHPLVEALHVIGGNSGAFFLLVPVLAGFIARSIAEGPGLAPGMVAGLLVADAGAGFIGGIVAGFLAGYVVEALKRMFQFIPVILQGIKPILIYPVFGAAISGTLLIFVLNEPLAAINAGLTSWLHHLSGWSAILLGLILGAMMAIDFGGPINKAAFTFGLAAIEAGSFGPQAAVMAGGMVPPLGLALATTLFKHKFTHTERKLGATNYLFGAMFITEGVIPYVANNRIRMIISYMVGAAIAGGLTMVMQITLPAPHGGIFVIPLVNSPIGYSICIAVGSFITAIMLSIWQKHNENP